MESKLPWRHNVLLLSDGSGRLRGRGEGEGWEGGREGGREGKEEGMP